MTEKSKHFKVIFTDGSFFFAKSINYKTKIDGVYWIDAMPDSDGEVYSGFYNKKIIKSIKPITKD